MTLKKQQKAERKQQYQEKGLKCHGETQSQKEEPVNNSLCISSRGELSSVTLVEDSRKAGRSLFHRFLPLFQVVSSEQQLDAMARWQGIVRYFSEVARVRASSQRPLESVKNFVKSVRSVDTGDKMAAYDIWAESYDQDVVTMGYDPSGHAAESVHAHFNGDREAAVVLDVACGTGLVAKQMKNNGFRNFVGIDGSTVMLEKAKNKGLYQDLKFCFLGEQQLPVQKGTFDVVVISGALSSDLIGISVVRELCNVCKPGGYVVMTCRNGPDNQEYKDTLERELKQMAEEKLWSCVAVTQVKNWMRSVSEDEFVSGAVYLYQKL